LAYSQEKKKPCFHLGGGKKKGAKDGACKKKKTFQGAKKDPPIRDWEKNGGFCIRKKAPYQRKTLEKRLLLECLEKNRFKRNRGKKRNVPVKLQGGNAVVPGSKSR